MSHSISEPDWKLFRQLREVALERFCQRVLTEIAQLSADPSQTPHQRYLAVFQLIERRDRELADAFNDPRRSTALLQLALIQTHSLLTEDEMTRFSEATREVIQRFPK